MSQEGIGGCAGRFWWRSRLCGRKAACDPGLGTCLLPFPVYNALLAAEAASLLCILWARGHTPTPASHIEAPC